MMNRITPKKALNKAFLKMRPHRAAFENFKLNLAALLNRTNGHESEEFHKNLLNEFLSRTYYQDRNFINTKGRKDLVIHLGKSPTDAVGVVIETKRPSNRIEMPTPTLLNAKAVQELVLYFMHERVTLGNIEIRHLIVTNISEWYLFDAHSFERAFAANKEFVRDFEDFVAGRLVETNTEFFYSKIAGPAISALNDDLIFTHFCMEEYRSALSESEDERGDAKLIELFKLLSPEHLLKEPFDNESNKLDRGFYTELLYILGLVEVKKGGKALIVRLEAGQRQPGSLIENAMRQVEAKDKLGQVKGIDRFGDAKETRLFHIALELSITWINRILFLKLLEAQLISFRRDRSLAFLKSEVVRNYASLDSLFFEVLARRSADRDPDIQIRYPEVPYLNSSLFEVSQLEHETFTIAGLQDEKLLSLPASTVLRDSNGARKQGKTELVKYVLDFLDSYDFGTDASELVRDDRRLINAAVLGLIFEKINGYRDGSYFTPGFVTMHISRETLRGAVVQKFNELKGWQCTSIKDVYNKEIDRKEANEIVNGLKICDPAVGSGHFLVSALNEIIAIKSDLHILCDASGDRLKEYEIEVLEDELVITDVEGDLFEYRPANRESHRVQEAIFLEKQKIIENCLFGVDINQNSVKICRLRLWIELLKHAYYHDDGTLETLPNIDINIKCGDSTISRFGLDEDLRHALKKSGRTLADYRRAVATYREATNKNEKREMEALINETKGAFRAGILVSSKQQRRLNAFTDELNTLSGQRALFEETPKEKREREKELKRLRLSIETLANAIADLSSAKVYENAFEWRFEFPEVLDDTGTFLGFDVIVANPPYIDSEKMVKDGHEKTRGYLSKEYACAKGNWDLYIVFMELGVRLLKDCGTMTYITPDKWTGKPFGNAFRLAFIRNLEEITVLGRDVFDSAIVDSIITRLSKKDVAMLTTSRLENESKVVLNKVNKSLLSVPFYLDPLLSIHFDFVHRLSSENARLDSIIECENACATSDCYKLKPYIADPPRATFDRRKNFRVVNTGTLDKYVSRWGVKPMTYLKRKYLRPIVARSVFDRHFPNSYGAKAASRKVIVKGLTLLDAMLDLDGEFIPGKSTLVLCSADTDLLKLVTAILNCPLTIFFIKTTFSASSYNGGISFKPEMLGSIPIPSKLTTKVCSQLVKWVDQIIERKAAMNNADVSQLEGKINSRLYELYGLTSSEILTIEEAMGWTSMMEDEDLMVEELE